MQENKIKYLFYVIRHPMDGFYEIRHREKGTVLLALLIVFLAGVSFSLNRQYAGFIVNSVFFMDINSIAEIMAVMLLFLLFCVANWSITCLMDGEGRLKDIVTVTGYAAFPIVLTFLPATILSRILVENEESFYYLVIGIGIVWFCIIFLIGIMMAHNFTLLKTLVTLFLTFVAMIIIIFLVMLLFSLVNQIYAFFVSLYTEIMLHI